MESSSPLMKSVSKKYVRLNAPINVRVENELKDALQKAAHQEKRTLSNLVVKILSDFVDQKE